MDSERDKDILREAGLCGKEIELLTVAVRRLAALEKLSVEKVYESLTPKQMTAQDIENRQYTYCQYLGPTHKTFLVPTRISKVARYMARTYILKEENAFEKRHLHIYPGNYVQKARKLFEQGIYLKYE